MLLDQRRHLLRGIAPGVPGAGCTHHDRCGAAARRSTFSDDHIGHRQKRTLAQDLAGPAQRRLVGIIGARGSGKTALADIIAAGGFALSPHLSERSFIRRAKSHLGESAAQLTWEDGDPTSNELRHVEMEDLLDSPRVQYLSQQFVDTLYSAEKWHRRMRSATNALFSEAGRRKITYNGRRWDLQAHRDVG
jgi:hypothetical protein